MTRISNVSHAKKTPTTPLCSIKPLAFEIRYSAKLENQTPFPEALWWRAPKTTVAATTEEAIATHERLVEEGHFAIYTDGSGIEDKIGASAVTVFTPIPGEAAITLDKKQALLGPLTEFTVYSGELIGLELGL